MAYTSRYAPSASTKSVDPKKIKETTDFEKFAKLACLGFLGSGPQAKRMKQTLICQWIFMLVFLYVWYRFNDGFLPAFLRDSSPKGMTPDVELVNHFPIEFADGSLISWRKDVNSKQELNEAIKSDVMMLEADVVLRGQGTPNQQLVPVMAQPPHTDGDLTAQQWLTLAKNSSKGIKLNFKNIEAVDLSLQHLKDIEKEIQVPVHLSAAVFDGPNSRLSTIKSIDGHRFLRLCMTHFPRSSIALGWNTELTEGGVKRYGWTAVKKMFDLIDSSGLKQPVTFNIQAGLARNSLAELKWLTEVTKGSLTLYMQSEVPMSDITYVRSKFQKHKIYYVFPDHLKEEFNAAKDSVESIPKHLTMDGAMSFRAYQWKVVRTQEEVVLYMGTESLLLGSGLLLSQEEFIPTDTKPVTVSGRLEFIQESTEFEGNHPDTYLGIEIFLRVSNGRSPSISGIRCFLNQAGLVFISATGVLGVSDASQQTKVPGNAPCFTFKIKDNLNRQVEFVVTRPKSCKDVSEMDYEGVVALQMKDVKLESGYVAVRKTDKAGFVAIDQLQIL